MGKMKRIWVEKKVRLEPFEAKLVEDAAHCARLPVAVYMRNTLVSGRAPEAAPPADVDRSFVSITLTSTIRGLISNLTQLEQHANRIGDPIGRLAESHGAIQVLRDQLTEIELANKAGKASELDLTRFLVKLQPVATHVNDQLARPLNRGDVVPVETWRRVLEELQDALLITVVEVS